MGLSRNFPALIFDKTSQKSAEQNFNILSRDLYECTGKASCLERTMEVSLSIFLQLLLKLCDKKKLLNHFLVAAKFIEHDVFSGKELLHVEERLIKDGDVIYRDLSSSIRIIES